jgi:hypothetical protein
MNIREPMTQEEADEFVQKSHPFTILFFLLGNIGYCILMVIVILCLKLFFSIIRGIRWFISPWVK